MTYITGDLVFSDAAYKSSEATSYLVPYKCDDPVIDEGSNDEPSDKAAAKAYCGVPFFGFDGIFWRARREYLGNVTLVGGTRPESSTRCTVGTAEKKLRSFGHYAVRCDNICVSNHSQCKNWTAMEAGNNLTSPERFYASTPEYQGFASRLPQSVSLMAKPCPQQYCTRLPLKTFIVLQKRIWMEYDSRFVRRRRPSEEHTRHHAMELPPAQHFVETGLSIQVTITFRNYPLTFDELETGWLGEFYERVQSTCDYFLSYTTPSPPLLLLPSPCHILQCSLMFTTPCLCTYVLF